MIEMARLNLADLTAAINESPRLERTFYALRFMLQLALTIDQSASDKVYVFSMLAELKNFKEMLCDVYEESEDDYECGLCETANKR